MMNVLALGLVLTSLVTAGIFSPSPATQKPAIDDVIVKDGHRVVVVEFEKDDGGHTKVLISPQDHEKPHAVVNPNEHSQVSEEIENTGETDDDASSTKPEEEEEGDVTPGFKPRELVCDAYGKCKHRILSAFEKSKNAMADKAHEVLDVAKEAASVAVGHVQDEISEKFHETKEGARRVGEEIKEEASQKTEDAREIANSAKESVIMRGVRAVGSDVFKYIFSPGKWIPLLGILHLMGFAAAYGMCVWVTFASSYVLAGSLPRGQFAVVQSRIYPVYFRAVACSVGLSILGHVVTMRSGLFQGISLLAALGMVLVNMLYLEPKAAMVMVERMKKDKEEGSWATMGWTAENAGRGGWPTATGMGRKEKAQQEADMPAKAEVARLKGELQRLNSYSSFVNVLTIMSLTWHLVHLGQRLHVVCH